MVANAVAPTLHGGVGQQSSQLWLSLLGQITPAALSGRHHRQVGERADAWNPRETPHVTRCQ